MMSKKSGERLSLLVGFGAVAIALFAGCSSSDKGKSEVPPDSSATEAADVSVDPGTKAWNTLMAGNARYVANRPARADDSPARRMELVSGQAPLAVVLSCSDSRVPPEIVFDEGLGRLFVIRVAGNTADQAAIGSIEYAVSELNVPLVVVMGHERCGAVKAAVSVADTGQQPPGHMGAFADPIVPAVTAAKAHGGDIAEMTMEENVRLVVAQLQNTQPVLATAVHDGKVRIVGCKYELESGRVVSIGGGSSH